jgi:hypothetical protein
MVMRIYEPWGNYTLRAFNYCRPFRYRIKPLRPVRAAPHMKNQPGFINKDFPALVNRLDSKHVSLDEQGIVSCCDITDPAGRWCWKRFTKDHFCVHHLHLFAFGVGWNSKTDYRNQQYQQYE